MLKLEASCREDISRHGEKTYPHECCGALLGIDLPNGNRHITEVLAIENEVQENTRRRYLVAPKAMLRIEKEARARNLEVLGIYHSHPDHPSRPSEFDREHAWPFWSYVIVSVRKGQSELLQSWRLLEDRSSFEEERLIVED